MRTRFKSEADRWSAGGAKITSSENLAVIRETLEKWGPVIVEHWFYRGGSGPRHLVFDEFDQFMSYLDENAYAGDAIDVWSVWHVCKPEARIAEGKCPDESGLVPKGGAY